ncbi:MAG: hypothetical protein RL203_312, partial [Pseudomonadota bacterium]
VVEVYLGTDALSLQQQVGREAAIEIT